MLVPHDWIACGWRELLIPYQYQFRPEPKWWSRKQPPCRPGAAPYAVLPKIRRRPRTSNHDRFALATPNSHCVSSLRPGHDHQCRYPPRTSESPVLPRFGKACNELGTSDTDRLCEAPGVRLRRGVPAREQPFAGPAICRDPLGERVALENWEQPHLRR